MISSTELPQPPVIPSANGTLETTLVVKVSRLGGPISFNRRSYNGMPVGPTLRVKRGDTIKLTLDNQLGTEPVSEVGKFYSSKMKPIGQRNGNWFHDWDVYAYPNVTNLHLHGLHVDPAEDNVTRRCEPQEQIQYEYHIPADHPTGLFWYHPHLDGSSALQLASGMMGALIIDDDEEAMPAEIKAMKEVVMVIHEVAHSAYHKHNSDSKNILCYFCIDNFAWPSGDRLPYNKVYTPEFQKCSAKFPNGTWMDLMQKMQPFDCEYLLINGEYQPTVSLAPGEWQRWRIVQSSHQSALRFDIEGCEKVVLARDGLYLDAPRKIDGPYVVTAGSRVDMAVRCSAPGNYSLVSLTGGIHHKHDMMHTKSWYEPVVYPRLVLKLLVRNEPARQMAAPVKTPSRGAMWPDLLQAKVDQTFKVVYNLTAYGTKKHTIPDPLAPFLNGGEFAINKQSYTGMPIHCARKGRVEEWTVHNNINGLDRWMHSFHIHINPFQIVSQNFGLTDQLMVEQHMQRGDWRDTVQIPVGGNVTFRYLSRDYTGT